MSTFTVEALSKAVERDLQVREFTERGAFQLQFGEMVEKKGRVSDLEVCQRLTAAYDKLTAAGYEHVEVRLSMQTREGAWKPWPCIWVNKAPRTNDQQNAKLAALEENVNKLTELMGAISQALLTKQVAAPTVDAAGDGVIVEEGETPIF